MLLGNDNRILDHEFIEDKSLQCPAKDALMEKQSEWEIIDDLIELYQRQYRLDIEQTILVKEKSDQAAMQLIEKFQPLFKKYISLLKTGQINFSNSEQRLFVALFMDDLRLRKALYSNASISREIKKRIEAFAATSITQSGMKCLGGYRDLQKILLISITKTFHMKT